MPIFRNIALLDELCLGIANHARVELPVKVDAVAGLEARGRSSVWGHVLSASGCRLSVRSASRGRLECAVYPDQKAGQIARTDLANDIRQRIWTGLLLFVHVCYRNPITLIHCRT